MRRFVEWVVERRRLVIVTTLLVTSLLALPLRRVENVVDTDSLHPQGHPYVIDTKTVERSFGGHITMFVSVTARSGSILQPALLEKLAKLTAALAAMPGTLPGKTLSLASAKVKDLRGSGDGLEARPVLAEIPKSEEELRALEQRIARHPLLDGILVARDRRTAGIVTQFEDSPDGYQALESLVESTVAPYRDDAVEIFVTGQPVYMSALERFSARMAFLLPLAILVTALVHYEAFRSVQGLVLPLVTALLAVVWGLGIMSFCGMSRLDPFSNAAPILIIAVAAGHAVQILKRYYEAYHALSSISDRNERSREAVVEAVTAIGPVMMAAGGIAAASFLSLLVFTVPSVRTFGVFSAAGVASALLIELTFIPAVRASLRPPGDRAVQREHSETPWDRVLSSFAGTVLGEGRRIVFACTALLCALMLVGAQRIVHDSSVRDFFSPDLSIRVADAAVNDRLAGTNNLSILVDGDRDDAISDPTTLEAMQRLQRLLQQDPRVGATVSIADFVTRMNRAMHGDDPAFETIPDSAELIAQYFLLYSMSGDRGDFDSWVDPSSRRAVIQAFVKTDSSAFVAEMDHRLAPLLHEGFGPGLRASIAGSMTTPAALNDMVVEGKLRNMAMVAAVVFMLSTLLFRSLAGGLLVLVPLAMVAIVNFGMLGWLGIPLQVATATVAALAIGVGADYAIYFTYRLRSELREQPDLETALRRSFATAGKASLYVASAVGGGYAVLMLSSGFRIHLWLGGMVTLAMFVSVGSALLLYPALLLWLRPAFVFGPAPLVAAELPEKA